MDSLIFELQIVFYFQLFLSANVRHTFQKALTMYVIRCNFFGSPLLGIMPALFAQ